MNYNENDEKYTRGQELENNIFNLVITLSRYYSDKMPAEIARNRVADYLERLSQGLRNIEDKDKNND